MKDLIGKKFRRNKYGLSIWEDYITSVYFTKSYVMPTNFKLIHPKEWGNELLKNDKYGYKLIPMVKGTLKNGPFQLDEIIIYP